MTIRVLKNDEKFSTACKVNGKSVSVAFAVRASENAGDRLAITTSLDFSKVSNADLMELACRSVIIDLQRQWRVAAAKDKKAAMSSYPNTVDVQASVVDEKPRAAADPKARVKSAFAKMTPAEKAALLRELQGNATPAPTTAPARKAG